MSRVSVLMPAREEPYLNKTIDDVFEKATGDIEVVVIIDGYRPDIMPKERKNLKIVVLEESQGMRRCLNMAAGIATGEYLMKTDAHCLFPIGFDELFKNHHEDNWLSIPSRRYLDVETWAPKCGSRNDPVEYEFVGYPFTGLDQPIGGLHAKKWRGPNGQGNNGPKHYYWLERKLSETLTDEVQTWIGFCWFMSKTKFMDIGGLDESFWNIHVEAQELGFKTWLSGGQLMVNKRVCVSHWWKNDERRIYQLDWEAMRKTQAHSTWYWMSDQWPKLTKPFKWFVDHFWPIPGWPENWEEEKKRFEREHPTYQNADYLKNR